METASISMPLLQTHCYAPADVWEMTSLIHCYVKREIKTRDHDVIHDITRTIQSKVARRAQGFNKTFLRLVAKNTCRDYLRHLYSERKTTELLENDHICNLGNTIASPESMVINRALITDIESKISPWLFVSFQRLADGLSQRNVFETYAQAHCKSYGDFRVIIYRTRKKLQTEWN